MLVVGGTVACLALFWPWPVAVAAVAVLGTAGRGALRGHDDRAVARVEQAAVEGLGVVVAELRAGRPGDEALAAAGRHSDDPLVGGVLSRLARSLRLGDRLHGWYDADSAPSDTDPRMPLPAGAPSAARLGRVPRGLAHTDSSDWQARLVDGLRLSQSSGCALADVVAAVETDLAKRGRQRADVRAAAAGHRATVALLAGLPVLGLAMGSGIGAEPVRILTMTPIGNVLLLTGLGLELLGLAWSRQMTGRAMRDG